MGPLSSKCDIYASILQSWKSILPMVVWNSLHPHLCSRFATYSLYFTDLLDTNQVWRFTIAATWWTYLSALIRNNRKALCFSVAIDVGERTTGERHSEPGCDCNRLLNCNLHHPIMFYFLASPDLNKLHRWPSCYFRGKLQIHRNFSCLLEQRAKVEYSGGHSIHQPRPSNLMTLFALLLKVLENFSNS